ncbi:unnamed protein product, partial [Thlaspi arvense]
DGKGQNRIKQSGGEDRALGVGFKMVYFYHYMMIDTGVESGVVVYAHVQRQRAEVHQFNTWEGYVDWRNRPALKGRHGGMLAASYVLGQ